MSQPEYISHKNTKNTKYIFYLATLCGLSGLVGELICTETLPKEKVPHIRDLFFICLFDLYSVSDILTCTPALVLVMGALEEIYGITLRWSK